MSYDVAKQHSKGKLHAMERINLLLDKDTFQEIGSGTALLHSVWHGEAGTPHDGVITGFGTVNGKPVAVYSQDFTVMGGTLGEMHGKKIARSFNWQSTASARSSASTIAVVHASRRESTPCRIRDIFRLNTLASGYIPQISVIVGPCAGGAVYSPGITDFVFMVDSISHMFVTGPNVVKKVLYQEIDKEALGGAQMHAAVSGVCHFRENTEEECFSKVRSLLSYLPQSWDEEKTIVKQQQKQKQSVVPEVPKNPKISYDVREVVGSLVDPDSFFEVSEEFARNIVVGFASLDGNTVGIIANQTKVLAGVLDCDASDKASRFIRFCDAFNIPLLTFVDVPGFLPGLDQEKKGIIRHGAKLLYAYAESTVPKITLILRKAYGGAYIAMCSKHLGADFVYSWESGEIAVMGAEGAVEILFRKELQESTDSKQMQEQLEREYTHTFINPMIAAQSGIIDEIIEPEETRTILIRSLQQLQTKEQKLIKKKHGNMPL